MNFLLSLRLYNLSSPFYITYRCVIVMHGSVSAVWIRVKDTEKTEWYRSDESDDLSYFIGRRSKREKRRALLDCVSADTFLPRKPGREGRRLRESITIPLPRWKGLRLYEYSVCSERERKRDGCTHTFALVYTDWYWRRVRTHTTRSGGGKKPSNIPRDGKTDRFGNTATTILTTVRFVLQKVLTTMIINGLSIVRY